jgi:DeoR/GlpR family transcriptional regulator of sugar metabolism
VKGENRSFSGCGRREVQVNDLSHLYGVSTVTIRNDLAFLEKQGIAVRAVAR